MALHDFKCKTCEHVFEDIWSSGKVMPTCPICKAEVEKVISAPSNYSGAVTKYVNRKLGPRGAKYKD